MGYFPPTWVVIDNGYPTDKETSEKIVDYLSKRVPPVIAFRREVPPDQDPDPLDIRAHGIIIVGGPKCWWPSESKWHWKYLSKMNPGWLNIGSVEAPDFQIFKNSYITKDEMACLISKASGELPWLEVWNVAGISAEATVQAGELFCSGEIMGVWINKVKVADP